MAAAIVDNNIPFAAADTFSPLFKEMFPDSEIAKSYASARTKTTCIVNGALKPYFRYVCIPGAISLSKHKCNLPGLLKTLCNAEKLTMEGLVPLMEDGEQNVWPMLKVL